MEGTGKSSEVLCQEIEAQSEREAAEILEQAEKEGQTLLRQAEKEAEKIRSEVLARADQQAEQVRKRILSGVHLEIKKQQLRDRELLMDDVLVRVRKKLDAFRSEPAYKPVLTAWIHEGLEAMDSEDVILQCGSAEAGLLDKKTLDTILTRIKKETGRVLSVQVEKTGEPEGGVLILSADRRVRYDNRFSARIRRLEQQIRLDVMQRVFGGDRPQRIPIK